MKFTKMQGLGNDFVVVESDAVTPDDVRAWCDRRFGIGADGVLAVDARPTMRYWNADGGPAQMCGNGLRCVARYAVDRQWAPAGEWFDVRTPVGDRRARVDGESITVEIGPVHMGDRTVLEGWALQLADVGNPHAVAVVGDPDEVDVPDTGRRIGTHPSFPEGTNVEFAALTGPDKIRLRVWERGVGETLACGSGIVVAAAALIGDIGTPIEVQVPGGTAQVTFDAGSAYLTGPAVSVFTGTWPA